MADPQDTLMARIVAGDEAAIKSLYEASRTRVFNSAKRILRSASDAEEIVQETFVDVWKRAAQFDQSRGNAIGWIMSIARSRAIDRLRQKKSSERTVASATSNKEIRTSPGVRSWEPLLRALNQESSALLQEAMHMLHDAHRQSIELAYFIGFTQEEIATHTEQPIGTVKTRVRAAMSRLSEILDPKRQL